MSKFIKHTAKQARLEHFASGKTLKMWLGNSQKFKDKRLKRTSRSSIKKKLISEE